MRQPFDVVIHGSVRKTPTIDYNEPTVLFIRVPVAERDAQEPSELMQNFVRPVLQCVFRFSLRRLLVCVVVLAVGISFLLRPAWQRHRIHQQIATWGGYIFESTSVSALPTETARQRVRHSYWQWVERLLGKDYADSCTHVRLGKHITRQGIFESTDRILWIVPTFC